MAESMKLTTVEIIREIRARSNGQLSTQDINFMMKLLEDIIVDELKKGNSVKIRSLLTLTPVVQPETTAYDGLNKRYYNKPEHTRVSIKPLGKLTKIDDK